MAITGIYYVKNVETGFVYIGQSIDMLRRLMTHKTKLRGNYHPNQHLQNAFNKHGEVVFEFKILRECPVADMDFWERLLIQVYKAIGKSYNIDDGGNAQKTRPDSVKLSVSIANKGNTYSVGRVMSEETRKKISASRLGQTRTQDSIDKQRQSIVGRTHTTETRKKMSDAAKSLWQKRKLTWQ